MPGPIVVCFGEVLWDVLPTGKVAGGAPMNVAFHLNNFGVEARMASRIGDDEPGRELKAFLEKKGLDTRLIQADPAHPTSTVQVKLDAAGHASYTIVQPVAWDFIEPQEGARDAVKEAQAIVFGSLAARSEVTRDTLEELLALAGLRVFDVNLRAPFYSRELLESLLQKSSLAKMNDEELDIIAAWYGQHGNERAKLESIRGRFGLEGIIVTKGGDGAIFLNSEGLFANGAYPVKIQDTIGSGDSFLAAFLAKYLKGAPPQECLQFACATGALVATRKGGTPEISEQEVMAMIQSSK